MPWFDNETYQRLSRQGATLISSRIRIPRLWPATAVFAELFEDHRATAGARSARGRAFFSYLREPVIAGGYLQHLLPRFGVIHLFGVNTRLLRTLAP